MSFRSFSNSVATIALLLAGWWALSRLLPPFMVPPPLKVFFRMEEVTTLLLADSAYTALEGRSQALALVASSLLAVLFRIFPVTEKYLMPYAIAMKSVPIVAVAPLFTMWFGTGLLGKVVLSSLICFFPTLVGLLDGMKSVPPDLNRLMKIWSTSRHRGVFLMELPFGAPYFLSSLKTAAPLAVVGAIVAEFLGADRGIGHAILVASYHTDIELVFAGIILASALGLLFFWLARLVESFVLVKLRVQHAHESL